MYALTKERDALRKGSEKIADYSALIKEKDGIIKQVRIRSLVLWATPNAGPHQVHPDAHTNHLELRTALPLHPG